MSIDLKDPIDKAEYTAGYLRKALRVHTLATTDDAMAVLGVDQDGLPAGVPVYSRAQIDDALAPLIAGQISNRTTYDTWPELAGVTGEDGQSAEVITDTGGHTDPVTGDPIGNDAGLYLWSVSPAGWEWKTEAANAALAARTETLEDVRVPARALKAEVPGGPLLASDIAHMVVNATTGEVVMAVTAWGEVISAGRPIADARYAYLRADAGGNVLEGVRHDGTVDLADRSLSAMLDAKFQWQRVGPNGELLEAFRRDGSYDIGALNLRRSLRVNGLFADSGAPIAARNEFGVELDAAAYDAWINGGQAYAYVKGSVIQLTDDDAYDWIKAEVRGGQIILVREDNLRLTSPLAGLYPMGVRADSVEYSDLYGQSVAAGNAASVLTSASFNDRFWMLGASQRAYGSYLGNSQERTREQQAEYAAVHDIVTGHEDLVDGAGETSNSGFAYGVLGDASFPATSVLLTTCSAVGSANIGMLFKAAVANTDPKNTLGDPWANLESKFIRAALFCRLQGKRFIAGPLRYNQGEGNYNATKANFLTWLKQVRDDWQALAKTWNALRVSGEGGVIGKAPFMVTQMCAGAHYSYAYSEVPWAQLQVNVDDPTTGLCVGPVYDQAYAADGVHLTALGQEMQGARQAVAYAFWLGGGTWYPLAVRKDAGFAPARVGTTVTLRLYNVLGLPLTFDATTITGLGADQGFVWHDNGDGNAVTVTNAVITNSTTITLTLSAIPTGTGGAIDVAMNGVGAGASGPSTGNRSTLRTNGSTVQTRSGRAVEHFICIDRVLIP